ncbi:MAG: hypothetical protein WA840_11500 [Caulobacteraceae bacterium]
MKRIGGNLAAGALVILLATAALTLFARGGQALAAHALAAEYASLKIGMQRDRADRVMRSTGQEISVTELGGHVVRLVEWDGPGGAAVTANFSDERLIAKSESGLRRADAGSSPGLSPSGVFP